MYIETSSPRSKGHKAWLVSPQFKPTKGRCLQFYYHMYGSTIGALNILLMQNKTRSSPLWTLSGNQGNRWRIAQVTLNSQVAFSVSNNDNKDDYDDYDDDDKDDKDDNDDDIDDGDNDDDDYDNNR